MSLCLIFVFMSILAPFNLLKSMEGSPSDIWKMAKKQVLENNPEEARKLKHVCLEPFYTFGVGPGILLEDVKFPDDAALFKNNDIDALIKKAEAINPIFLVTNCDEDGCRFQKKAGYATTDWLELALHNKDKVDLTQIPREERTWQDVFVEKVSAALAVKVLSKEGAEYLIYGGEYLMPHLKIMTKTLASITEEQNLTIHVIKDSIAFGDLQIDFGWSKSSEFNSERDYQNLTDDERRILEKAMGEEEIDFYNLKLQEYGNKYKQFLTYLKENFPHINTRLHIHGDYCNYLVTLTNKEIFYPNIFVVCDLEHQINYNSTKDQKNVENLTDLIFKDGKTEDPRVFIFSSENNIPLKSKSIYDSPEFGFSIRTKSYGCPDSLNIWRARAFRCDLLLKNNT